ncbi:hypothetical protein [Nocardiopsis synnemataformans]|uniref:hypothetical protein n=1 Tax=Nocardiopsis synnemataformans TaxID=61305 RepID=UPI003EB6AB84
MTEQHVELLERAVRRIHQTSSTASPSSVMAFGVAGALAIQQDTSSPVARARQLAAIDHAQVWDLRVADAVADLLQAKVRGLKAFAETISADPMIDVPTCIERAFCFELAIARAIVDDPPPPDTPPPPPW